MAFRSHRRPKKQFNGSRHFFASEDATEQSIVLILGVHLVTVAMKAQFVLEVIIRLKDGHHE